MTPPTVPSSPEGTSVDVILAGVLEGLQRASALLADDELMGTEAEAIIESAIDRLVAVRDQIVRDGLFRGITEATSPALDDFSERVPVSEFDEPHKWVGNVGVSGE